MSTLNEEEMSDLRKSTHSQKVEVGKNEMV